MFKLSIIVPAHGPQENLDNTLLTVLENRPPACEVIVPHPSAYQDPYDLSDEVTFVRASGEDLASLVNSAVEVAQATVIHVLLSGTLAREGWTEAAIERFRSEPDVAALAPAILDPQHPHRLTAAGIRYARGGAKRLVARGRSQAACATNARVSMALCYKHRSSDATSLRALVVCATHSGRIMSIPIWRSDFAPQDTPVPTNPIVS